MNKVICIMNMYIFLLLWSWVSKFISENNSKIYLALNFIPLILFCGLRDISLGADTEMYNYLFYVLSNDTYDIEKLFFLKGENIEYGYALLNKICFVFTHDSQYIIFLIALLTLFGYAHFFYKVSRKIWLSTFLFIGLLFYADCFNGIRQCIAGMLLCNGYYLLIKEQKIKYFFLIIFACFFHATSIVFLIFIFLLPITFRKLFLIIFLGICILIGFDYFIENIDLFGAFSQKYIYYINSNQYGVPSSSEYGFNGFGRLFAFIVIIIISWAILLKKEIETREKNEILLCSSFLVIDCFIVLAQNIVNIFARFHIYFAIYICILIPVIIKEIGKTKYAIWITMFISVWIYCYYAIYHAHYLLRWF